jgi:hypothetical protein
LRPRSFAVQSLPKHMTFCIHQCHCCWYDWWINKTALVEEQSLAMIIGDDVILHKMWCEIGRGKFNNQPLRSRLDSIGNQDSGRSRECNNQRGRRWTPKRRRRWKTQQLLRAQASECNEVMLLEQFNPNMSLLSFAMKHHPVTVNVDLICGWGCQLLSETVELRLGSKQRKMLQFVSGSKF